MENYPGLFLFPTPSTEKYPLPPPPTLKRNVLIPAKFERHRKMLWPAIATGNNEPESEASLVVSRMSLSADFLTGPTAIPFVILPRNPGEGSDSVSALIVSLRLHTFLLDVWWEADFAAAVA